MSLCKSCAWHGYIEDDKGNKSTWCKAKTVITTDFSGNIIKCTEHKNYGK